MTKRENKNSENQKMKKQTKGTQIHIHAKPPTQIKTINNNTRYIQNGAT